MSQVDDFNIIGELNRRTRMYPLPVYSPTPWTKCVIGPQLSGTSAAGYIFKVSRPSGDCGESQGTSQAMGQGSLLFCECIVPERC